MSTASLDHLDAQQLRALAERLMGEVATRDAQIAAHDAVVAERDRVLHFKQTHIDQLMQKLALYKRWRYGKRSEQLNPAQARLLEETMDADLAAIEEEVNALRVAVSTPPAAPQAPLRMRLPPELPRTELHHEPASTTCRCGCGLKRIGEDVSEKLDYLPGVFTGERHIRGKWVCEHCETLTQAPVPAQVIDKGILTTALWRRYWRPSSPTTCRYTARKASLRAPAWRCRARRWASGSACAGCGCSRWSMRSRPMCWANPCCMPTRRQCRCSIRARARRTEPTCGHKHRPSFDSLRAVLYDFAPSRAREHCRTFLQDWRGKLVTTIMPATRPASLPASRHLAAWRTPGASSMTCMQTTTARSPERRWSCSARSKARSGT